MRLHSLPVNAVLVFIAFAWLLLFAHGGIGAEFSGDDLMNLHGHLSRGTASLIVDNLRYWSTSYRPLGGLFYVAIYRCFGFQPLPFRVACFGLLALNLSLLWRFTLRLSGRREVAFLALLLAGYHAWFIDLYYSTGTVTPSTWERSTCTWAPALKGASCLGVVWGSWPRCTSVRSTPRRWP
jgi:hypothetical protein